MTVLPPLEILHEQMAAGDRHFQARQYKAAHERYYYVADTLNSIVNEHTGKAGKIGLAAGAVAGFLVPFGHIVTVPLAAWLGRKMGRAYAESCLGNSEYLEIFLRAVEQVRACQQQPGFRR